MSELRYTSDHEWIKREADGTCTVGITDYAQEQLGDIVFVELPEIGRTFAAGDEAVVIESVKAAADVKMPVSGEIVGVNESLADAPETVNSDPLGSGWFLKIKPDSLSDVDALLDQAAYDALTSD
jgi:glycine cleavage system H protein